MFTAALVLQLAHEGRLRLDASVQRYLPGLLPASYQPIRVRSLLDHTSGLPASTEDDGYEDPAYFVAHRFDHFTPRQVVRTATDRPLLFEPGSEQHYNGVNYFVAGLLIEAVTGESYAHELRTRILRPLGLTSTALPSRRELSIEGAHAHGYVVVDDVPVDVTAQSAYGWAESGIVSSTRDLTRFLKALLRGDVVPRPERSALFDLPDVPYRGTDNCARGPQAGRACFSAGLTRTELPNGVVVWGKSGSVSGTTTAAFATRDLTRSLVYAVHPTGNRDGSEGPVLQRIVEAAFSPQR
jgi:D-alanyl-D-alanine carboxypeptidase